jgi:hypothetical protein
LNEGLGISAPAARVENWIEQVLMYQPCRVLLEGRNMIRGLLSHALARCGDNCLLVELNRLALRRETIYADWRVSRNIPSGHNRPLFRRLRLQVCSQDHRLVVSGLNRGDFKNEHAVVVEQEIEDKWSHQGLREFRRVERGAYWRKGCF